MQIKELFTSDVTRDIPPVVYFHEQRPEKLAAEVSEYIITGGFPAGHPHHSRVPDGIHEQYVHLLRAIAQELKRQGGPDLPASWISGFYGSGKSSFAKLLGLALDGKSLPDGTSLSAALLARDTSPLANEFQEAWSALRTAIDPISVVFDIGGMARDAEHIHTVVLRQIQERLGYCSKEQLVAEFELDLERDGHWEEFEATALRVLGKPWVEAKERALADEDFSEVMHALDPERYVDPMSWIKSRAGTKVRSSSPTEATAAIADMLRFRAPGKTLFIVVDEVSQYIHQDQQRMLKLQSFVSELGQRLKGKAWLLVTGQQKLEEADETEVLGKLKGRFKPSLRVHLAATNIRDVVHRRLLQKTQDADRHLRELFQKHRNDLKLFAYECESITEEDFVEVYPMLPGHIDLLLQITTALRTRSTRSQGDDQAIRGLLQLLGELFRTQKLAEMPVGNLVTIDQIYEVQRSALDSDTQNSMLRILDHCNENGLELAARAAKAVALLELIQDSVPTHASLIAACLHDRLDRGKQEDKVTEALEALRPDFLGYSEKQGYKLQSSSAEEWERERREIPVSRDEWVDHVQDSLKYLLSQPTRPTLQSRPFAWMAYFSDSHRAADKVLLAPRDPANVAVDFRMLNASDRDPKTWVNQSSEDSFKNRIVWVAGDPTDLEAEAREYGRSLGMLKRNKSRRESMTRDRQRLLFEEEARAEDLEASLQKAVDRSWMAGTLYFRGRPVPARELGASFTGALLAAGNRFLPDLFPSLLTTSLTTTELLQLLEPILNAPSPKFLDELGILSLDAGKYVPSCHGVAPQRILEFVASEQAIGGSALLEEFGGPPYGYTAEVVRACVAGLLRAGRLKIESDSVQGITATRDAGAREIFEKDRGFKRATFFPAEEGQIDDRAINQICRFFQSRLNMNLERDRSAIADAVGQAFQAQAERLRQVLSRLRQLPDDEAGFERVPQALVRLETALEGCMARIRQTEPTVVAVKRHLDHLNDGLEQLAIYDAELTDESIASVRVAADVLRFHVAQLSRVGGIDSELEAPVARIREQFQSDKPWRDIGSLDADLESVRTAYVGERQRILAEVGELEEMIRARVKGRTGFSTLNADQSHHVLRPIAEAFHSTSDDAVAPTLTELRDRAVVAITAAEEESNELLDEILSEGEDSPIRKVELRLRNREVSSVTDLEAVLDEVRALVEPELRAGRRVRLA